MPVMSAVVPQLDAGLITATQQSPTAPTLWATSPVTAGLEWKQKDTALVC